MRNREPRFILLPLLAAMLSACAAAPTTPEPVAEIRPGILMGYLAAEDYPDSLALLPPPPPEDSSAQAADTEISIHALTLQGSPRFELASQDNNLHFPEAASTFACALDIPIGETTTPFLYQLLRRSLADAGLATYAAKNHYERTRPFLVNGADICAPDQERAMLEGDPSYPSGHTAIGWAWALILTSLAPERADELLGRGMAYGESRVFCNVHWPTDVAAGRVVGAAAVAVLQGNEDFQRDFTQARREIAEARSAGLTADGNCDAERQTLETRLYPGESAD